MIWFFAVCGLIGLGVGAYMLLRQQGTLNDVDREAATFEIIE